MKACSTCTEACGSAELTLIDGVDVSAMSQLAAWTIDADKGLTFD